MKIIVCLKQTFDTEAKIQLDSNGRIVSEGIQHIINPYDEFAVEEALRIKEKLGQGEVVVISLGGGKTEEALRQALAMGADRAVLIKDDAFSDADAHVVATALAKAIGQMEYDLILGGQVAIDDGASQVMSRLAEVLDLPQVNVVTKLEIEGTKAVVHREADGGTEIIEVTLPAVLTAQKGLNEPRYPSLKGIMAAKKKELRTITASDLGIDMTAGSAGVKTEVIGYMLPPARKDGKLIQGDLPGTAQELVRLLREEAKII